MQPKLLLNKLVDGGVEAPGVVGASLLGHPAGAVGADHAVELVDQEDVLGAAVAHLLPDPRPQTLDLAPGWIDTLVLTLPETEAEFDRVYSIEVSLVVVDGAGAEKTTAPASIHYLVGSESSKTAVEGLPGFLGSKGVETSGVQESTGSKTSLLGKARTGKFGGGFVPYL